MPDRQAQIERIRRMIDRIAYYSLILDISIACVTSLSLLKIGEPEAILVPINYLLTAVVILSLGLFVALFTLKHEENILDTLLGRKYKFSKAKSIMERIKMKLIYYYNKRRAS